MCYWLLTVFLLFGAETCCETDSTLPSGSLNQATLSPVGAVQIPSLSCSGIVRQMESASLAPAMHNTRRSRPAAPQVILPAVTRISRISDGFRGITLRLFLGMREIVKQSRAPAGHSRAYSAAMEEERRRSNAMPKSLVVCGLNTWH
jgi:hypothetical protein